MAMDLYDEVYVPTDPEEQRRIHTEVLRRWLRAAPEAADEIVQQERERDMRHVFERRLGRALDAAEQVVLHQRLAALGGDRLLDVVLELNGDALAAWLADPTAR